MRAIILAAGQGSRLLPHTEDRPKCLVELAGRPLLAWQLAVLRDLGIADIVLVGGYRAEQLRRWHPDVVVNAAYRTTNMVRSLFCAEAHLRGDADILIAYSDIVYEPRVAAALLESRAPVAVAVNTAWRELWQARMADPLADAETLRIGADGRLLEIGRKAGSYDQVEAQYMGLIKVDAAHAARLRGVYDAMAADGRFAGAAHGNMYLTDFLQRLCDDGWPVHAERIDGGWLEVDSVEDLALYEALAAAGQLDRFCRL
ncbi:MAG: phosphocholine cytidylyltransferase family protein [Alphaproteobacteria bacterium]|nr:phosphocholine cytidylyltransferase family protein [Alphaproteobacteria bacterium]MDP6563475.1 phosphocholine cytidylyltransferase family protein [Alphaproteobacteria bacterium]